MGMNTSRTATAATECFYCQECGYKFRTIKAAEKVAFGPNGCPKCGSSDIDLGKRDTEESSTEDSSLTWDEERFGVLQDENGDAR